MRLSFVTTSMGNHFMTELLEALAFEAVALGIDASVVADGFPRLEDDLVYIVIPHEYFALAPEPDWPDTAQLARTISLGVEMPGTLWFDLLAELAGACGAALSINTSALGELRRRGVAATHLQLGYTERWDRWHGDPARTRPTDVVYLGSADERRERLLAGCGPDLWPWRAELLIPPLSPKTGPRADFVVGEAKYDKLARSKVLLNLHRGQSRSLEWVRVLEAMSNGCAVVSEHSADHLPLEPGSHLISVAPESVGPAADHLLGDPDRRAALAEEAYRFVRSELTMHTGVIRMLDVAEQLASNRRHRAGPVTLPVAPATAPVAAPRPPGLGPSRPDRSEVAILRGALKRLATQQLETTRLLQRMADPSSDDLWDEDGVRLAAASAAARMPGPGPEPRVSVLVTVFNYEAEVLEALRSVAGSDLAEVELLVLDDASADRSLDSACRFAADHPWLSVRVYASRTNGGPSRGRNILTRRARSALVFQLDADNRIYPTTLGRLVEALEADPRASFAYPMLAKFARGAPVGLLSAGPWEPERLVTGNYIDTMALLRRDDLLALGGYREDVALVGLEDFDLWCRFAEAGRRGVLVPQVLAEYRLTGHSVQSLTSIDVEVAHSLIAERSPRLFAMP